MPEISSVRERRGRARVFVDGEFWAEIDAGEALEQGVVEGAVFSPEELNLARVAGERPVAMGRALNLLGYRARSEAEMRERLGVMDTSRRRSRPSSFASRSWATWTTRSSRVSRPARRRAGTGRGGSRPSFVRA